MLQITNFCYSRHSKRCKISVLTSLGPYKFYFSREHFSKSPPTKPDIVKSLSGGRGGCCWSTEVRGAAK